MAKFDDSEIRACFDAMDTDKSGKISRGELGEGLKQLGQISEQDLKELVQVIMESENLNQSPRYSKNQNAT